MIEAQRLKYAAKHGYSPTTTDPDEQIAMCESYAVDRYGTVEEAWKFWQANNWW